MYRYYNANPNKSNIEDCTIRALSVAEGISWDEAYELLSDSARKLGLMQSDVKAIEEYLNLRYIRIPIYEDTVGEFIKNHPKGVFLITMPGHITVLKNGINYDTFDSSNRIIWNAWLVKQSIPYFFVAFFSAYMLSSFYVKNRKRKKMKEKELKKKEKIKDEEKSSTAYSVIRFVNKRLQVATILLVVSLTVNIFSLYDSIKVRIDKTNENRILIEKNKELIEEAKEEVLGKIEELETKCGT